MSKLLKFVETDVDGCGTDVEVEINLKSNNFSPNWQRELSKALSSIKTEFIKNDECFDTDDIIRTALEQVFGKEVQYDVVYPEHEFEF